MELVGYTNQSLKIQLKFENPLFISIGSKLDVLIIKFVEPSLFVGRNTGRPIDPALNMTNPIPKQFLNEFYFSELEVVGTTVQAAANISFLAQVCVTVCLAVSLKAMWNLMHVM